MDNDKKPQHEGAAKETPVAKKELGQPSDATAADAKGRHQTKKQFRHHEPAKPLSEKERLEATIRGLHDDRKYAEEKIRELEAENSQLKASLKEEREYSTYVAAKICQLQQDENHELTTSNQQETGNPPLNDSSQGNRGLISTVSGCCKKWFKKDEQPYSTDSQPKVSCFYRTDKAKLQSSSAKINVAFGHHQGNTMEDAEMRSLWNKLFLKDAERDFPQSCDHSKKNEIRQDYCKKFLEIADSVKEELIKRITNCLEASVNSSQRLIPEIYLKEVKRAREILWEQLVNNEIPVDKISMEDIVRMVDLLKLLFTPSTDSDQEVSNMKTLETAFSILVNVPNVRENFPQSICLDESINSEFAESALSLCERMSTRVPPYLASISKECYVSEVHELKFVKGYLNPEEDPEMPMNYLRPIVYYNYEGHVLIPGMVVSSRRVIDAHNLGNTGQADSTQNQCGSNSESTQEEK
ncbi:uncharacterized protein LOC135335998 [Halichondria panicea]|uniref:uncharacterized protein LOC135335998 n=1 Tax=Halichondria panicea TaxID=6063 RepID=UPI00312B4B40